MQLLGGVSDDQLVELYNQARVTLYAPVREPFGLVPLEAMACATPVVAVQEGGIPETVLSGQTGLLVPRDPQQFAAAVQRLLADPELAAAYGQAGRQQVLLHWTWEQAAQTVEQHLTAVARPRGAPSAIQAVSTAG